MGNALRIAVATAASVAVLLLAGCGKGDDSTVDVVVVGAPDSLFETGARLSPAAQLVRAATVEGLVALDAQGSVAPALADRWIVMDDGASYIFRLRDGTWQDGTQITAESVRDGLRRAIAGLRDTPLSLDLAAVDEVRVMAGRVIEIRLSRPMPDFLQVLAQPEMGIVHRGAGAGPMRLERNGATAELTPVAPRDRGLPEDEEWDARVRTVRLSALPASAAVERFGKGDADVVLGGTIETFPLATGIGLSRAAIQFDQVAGLFGLIVVDGNGFLGAPENREAVAMAIDREAALGAVGLGGWTPSTRIVPAGLPGDLGTIGERWAGASMAERRAEAARRVDRWKAGGSGGPVRLRIALPAGPGSDRLFEALATDLRAAGIEAVRTGARGAADLRLIDLVARYPHAGWFLNQLGCGARRGLCSLAADRRVEEARTARDSAGRAALLAEAEAELTEANVFIPFGPPIRWSLVRDPAQVGFLPNRWGVHPLMAFALRPK